MNDLLAGMPWNTLLIFKELSRQLKQEYPLPDYTNRIALGTSIYETAIRNYWEAFKREPTKENAKRFVSQLTAYVDTNWPQYMADVLGVKLEDLSLAELALLEDEVAKHKDYLVNSLLPDLIKAIKQGTTNFDNFDYRVIFLYAGALWSLGFLATVLFDGVEVRDLADMFIFLGPNDENTCDGERGCRQHVGKIYTVAEILAQDIIPGHFRCLKSCRHILIPFISA